MRHVAWRKNGQAIKTSTHRALYDFFAISKTVFVSSNVVGFKHHATCTIGTILHAAVDVEDLAGDVSGFVAGEEHDGDGGGDVAVEAETAVNFSCEIEAH